MNLPGILSCYFSELLSVGDKMFPVVHVRAARQQEPTQWFKWSIPFTCSDISPDCCLQHWPVWGTWQEAANTSICPRRIIFSISLNNYYCLGVLLFKHLSYNPQISMLWSTFILSKRTVYLKGKKGVFCLIMHALYSLVKMSLWRCSKHK